MEEFKKLLSNPALFDAKLKEAWNQIDTKKEGQVPYDVFKAGLEQVCKAEKITAILPTSNEEREMFKKVADPNNTGKVNFENFKAVIKLGLERMK